MLSLVPTTDSPADSITWVAEQTRIWNVAITRAKSRLAVVGHRDLWASRSGLPQILTAHCTASADEHLPPTAIQDDERTHLADLLQPRLRTEGLSACERATTVMGHLCDFIITTPEGNMAVLIDTGPHDQDDLARHLWLLHTRADLLTGAPSGGQGASLAPSSARSASPHGASASANRSPASCDGSTSRLAPDGLHLRVKQSLLEGLTSSAPPVYGYPVS
ncbi:hypothetical protein ABH932_006315 [Streptacidiphilus sp. MAP5-52]